MARPQKRWAKRRGYNTAGGLGTSSQDEDEEDLAYLRRIDKNRYYRTNDILNAVLKRNPKIRLEAGPRNSTDLKTIWVNFGEKRMRALVDIVEPGSSKNKTIYLLECGHVEQLNSGHITDGTVKGACAACGSAQSYLGFEHEWSHIAFKSDLLLRTIFVEKYVDQLLASQPGVDRSALTSFLHFVVNAFDDLRVNSLWSLIYPGSANDIWARWKRITEEVRDSSSNFIGFIFAVSLGVPTDPDGPYEACRPIVAWGSEKVKYRGFAKMLIDVRVVLDRCMGLLLSKARANPQPQLAGSQQNQTQNSGQSTDQPQGQQGENDGEEGHHGDGGEERDDPGSSDPGSQGRGALASGGDPQEGRDGGADDQGAERDVLGGGGAGPGAGPQVPAQAGQGANGAQGGQDPRQAPSAQGATPKERLDALRKLATGASPLDHKEKHQDPDPAGISKALAQAPQAVMAAIAQAMNSAIDDLDAIDALLPPEPDIDMQMVVQQIQSSLVDKSKDSQLTSNAKASIQLIKVHPQGVDQSRFELDGIERATVGRLRSAFVRALGTQKNKRQIEGNTVDVQALVRHRFDQQDPEVFEADDRHKGFAYAILCDMSGSMGGTYPHVARAAEMLKQSLNFPFVKGELWGFRGGDNCGRYNTSSVWIYRYEKDCRGYTGMTKNRTWNQSASRFIDQDIPVECGGLTPMHSAVHVVSTQLRTQVPANMAKRLFLLTDGSPCHSGSSGLMSEGMLQSFVAKEINLARQHGVQVYTIIIGPYAIPDADCRKMFGAPRYWKKTSTGEVGDALSRLVLENFTKYLNSRN